MMDEKKIVIVVLIVLFMGWKIFYHPMFPDLPNGCLTPFSENSSYAVFKNGPCEGRFHFSSEVARARRE